MSVTLVCNATIANEGELRNGSVLISGDRIADVIGPGCRVNVRPDNVVDATGCLLLPGLIDDHVHFREPGLTHKATIASESRAAVAGGVTSFFDMPNCKPQTTTIRDIEDKCAIAATDSLANYSFYLGATRDNIDQIENVDSGTVCGVKLFMGSSTGGMHVDDREHIYGIMKASPIPVAVHCEDDGIIRSNMAHYEELLNGEPPVEYHPLIRSAEACYASSSMAVETACRAGARLHIMHISTARELSLFESGDVSGKRITAEACPAHLFFSSADYGRLGTRIKCNPAVKDATDRDALRSAVRSGLIDVIGTDHAPHLLSEKEGGCRTAASGMPVLPHSLQSMLELADAGVFGITDIVRTMCHNPAQLFSVKERGFIRKGYKADLTLVRRGTDFPQVCDETEPNLCRWTPFNGHRFGWKVLRTWVNGNQVYCDGKFETGFTAERILFDRH